MPVDTPHASYTKASPIWAKIRTAIEGSEAIKEAGKKYLPMPQGQTPEEYEVYKERALWYAATEATLRGLLGAMFRRSPTIELPPDLDVRKKSIDAEGRPIETFTRALAEEVTSVGRAGVLVDYVNSTTNPRAYLCVYTAESIINWRCQMVDGVEQLTLVVLREYEEVPTDDPFVTKTEPIYRVLVLLDNTYTQQLWRKNEKGEYQLAEEYVPNNRGAAFGFLPFVFVGVKDLSSTVQQAPLGALADVNISFFLTSADYEHACHLAGNPTYWASGVPAKDAQGKKTILPVGAATAWLLPTGAGAGVLTLGADGVGALKEARSEKKDEMSKLGGQFLRTAKNDAETVESMKLQASGETSLLALIVGSVESALQKSLEWLAWWEDANPDEVSVHLSREFFEARLSVAEVVSLLSQLDKLSEESPLTELIGAQLEEGEALPEGMTAQELVDRLREAAAKRKASMPTPPLLPSNNQPPTPPGAPQGAPAQPAPPQPAAD
jgi:hypothetical protein